MNFILFDTNRNYQNLLPLSYTRPVSEIRIGILTIKQKWEKYFSEIFSYYTKEYLRNKYDSIISEKNIFINSSILPDEILVSKIENLQLNQYLVKDNTIIAVCLNKQSSLSFESINFLALYSIEYPYEISKIEYVWDIFEQNGNEIKKDFHLITKNRQSQPISHTNTVVNSENIFIEEGAEVECSVLNAKGGYIYIGKNAVVMENSVIRGSLALCENSQLKVRTTIYGPVTIGPHSKVGGEISESVIFGYSNKAHDGFLGNSVIAEWCNLGAGTNNSNLKNNYEIVKLWNYREQKFISTGLQFCGLIMGDHSKCGINTMFNTGTVVGVNCNIFGAGFPRNFIPSYSWGGAHGFSVYQFEKAIETAKKVMIRRKIQLSEYDMEILKYIFDSTVKEETKQ